VFAMAFVIEVPAMPSRCLSVRFIVERE